MRAPLRPVLLATLLVWLTACVPHWSVQPARTGHLDLAGPTPDVVILGIAGRCSQPCVAPRDNFDYLSSRGTLDALADIVAATGRSVQVAGYSSHPAASHTSPYLSQPQPGFAALLADVTRLQATWLKEPAPPHLILLAHSQGVVWSHLLTRTFQDVPFAVQIDLDGLCVAWRSDYGAAVRSLAASPALTADELNACDKVQVAGRGVPLKDVVWPNVALNLEVQSKRLPARTSASGGLPVNYLFELSRNTRLDGTTTGIERFVSVREDHSSITYPNSDAVGWIIRQLRPVVQAWAVPAMPTSLPASGTALPSTPLPTSPARGEE